MNSLPSKTDESVLVAAGEREAEAEEEDSALEEIIDVSNV